MPNNRIGLLLLRTKPIDSAAILESLYGLIGKSATPEPQPSPELPVPSGPLEREQMIQYVKAAAPLRHLDAAAVLAVAEQEGLGGGIGDGGLAYGPWQDHLTEFAGRPWYGYGRNNAQVQAWAYSSAGADYSMSQMVANGAANMHGVAAIQAIVYGYERPQYPGAEVSRATANYQKWVTILG